MNVVLFSSLYRQHSISNSLNNYKPDIILYHITSMKQQK